MAHCGRWSWPECSMLSAGDKATSAASLGDASNVVVPWSSRGPRAGQGDTLCPLPAGAPSAARPHCIHVNGVSAAQTHHNPPSHVADESCAASSTLSSPSSQLQMPVCHPHPRPGRTVPRSRIRSFATTTSAAACLAGIPALSSPCGGPDALTPSCLRAHGACHPPFDLVGAALRRRHPHLPAGGLHLRCARVTTPAARGPLRRVVG